MSRPYAALRALAKVDSHHHLWDLSQGCHPWLVEPVAPRMYGDYSIICRDYLVEEFIRDSGPHNVVKSVHIQANWDPSDPVAETRWLQSVADQHGFPHGIVAHADLSAPDVDALLDAHGTHPNLRGIRQILGHTDDPHLTRGDRVDHLADPAWEHGYASLAARGLSFDLQAFPAQLERMAEIAASQPSVPVIVCHTGFPWDRSESGVARWRSAMASLAALPHAYAKLSGPGMVMPDWTPDAFAPFVHTTIDLFGPERCMFASNVPPDAIGKTYDQIFEGFYRWATRYCASDCRAMFHDTAAAVYRI